jgi:Flp pilus assembly pilin Flp
VTPLTRFYSWYNNVSSETISFFVRLRRVLTAGQGLAEYALILALIAIVAIIALIFLGGQVSKILSNVGHSV